VRIAIVDGYTDEPAALGVPPYLAPLPRYLAGAALDAGAEDVGYITIDQLRSRRTGAPKRTSGPKWRGPRLRPPVGKWDLMVLVGGAVVPGRYLRGRPASVRELREVAEGFRGPTLLAGPVARYGWTSGSATSGVDLASFKHVATGDGDAYLFDLVTEGRRPEPRLRTGDEWTRWPVIGAGLAASHPDHPRPLISEVETYRGCIRHAFGGCSFCTTVRDAPPVFRGPDEVAAEVAALHEAGVVAFRLGGQSCIYSYMARGVGETETPVPDPRAVGALIEGVRGAAPSLEVLHVDNANPAVVAENPEESAEVTRLLAKGCTGGNVVALGLESADPDVRRANNLNATPDQCLEAIRIIGRWGGEPTDTGLPALLPGVNFLAGLKGETPATFEANIAFLKEVMAEDLLLRRINIRHVAPVCDDFPVSRHHHEFRAFKEWVRAEVDTPMLERLLPYGAPLRRVWTEVHDGGTTFGRQVGSYPLTVGIPASLELGRFMDLRVIGYGARSVTAVPDPLPINDCPMSMLAAIPGIGRKRAARIVRARPIEDLQRLMDVLDDPRAADPLLPLLAFE
jgi:radical SAM superfamily enzyme with C-terminal helix-hairpin-helix motif